MIHGIILENFKSYKEKIRIPLGKITILIGPNNSGKSSILQSIILFSQSLKQQSRTFQPNNEVIDLGEYADIVSGNDDQIPLTIGIKGSNEIDIGGVYEDTFDPEDANYSLIVTTDRNNLREINFNVESEHSKINYHWLPTKTSSTLNRNYENQSLDLELSTLNGFIPSLILHLGTDELQKKFNNQFQGKFLGESLDKIYYIPFQRTIGKLGESTTSKQEFDRIVTRDPEITSSNLLSTLAKNRPLQQKVSEAYENVFPRTMSPHSLDPDFRNEEKRQVERTTMMFSKGRLGSSIANVGGGLNQLILLFTILVGSPKGSTICLEEPEIHLHPEKQSSVMKQMLKILKNDDKQIILTTHSEFILYPLLAAISKGELDQNDLVIHYVTQDEETLNSSVEKLEVNEHGQIKGGLKGFWDATTSAMKDFVREEDEG